MVEILQKFVAFSEYMNFTKIVRTYCEKKIVLVIEKICANSQPSASNFKKISQSLEQFVRTVKGQNNFWYQNAFLTYSWRYDKLKQLEYKLEKIIGIQKHSEKV